jgi:uncharacterized protein YkwD
MSLVGSRRTVARTRLIGERLEPRQLLSAAYPTEFDQYLLELVNRARANPAAEAAFYRIDLNEGLASGTISATAKQPLAFNPYLIDSAQKHSQWMLDTNQFSHTGSGGSDPAARMRAAGATTLTAAGENIATCTNWSGMLGAVDWCHEALFVDTNYPERAHRKNLLNGNWREVGIGAKVEEDWFNTYMFTQDFCVVSSSAFLTGVAYDDQRIAKDNFYTPGEALAGITITATRRSDAKVFSTTTWSSGGYSLPLASGTYDIMATGAALGETVERRGVTVSGQNVKWDVLKPANLPPILATIGVVQGELAAAGLTITYRALAAAADEHDPEGQTVSFRIENVAAGMLFKGGEAVVAGQTLLAPGESLVWMPPTNSGGTVAAFSVRAFDGQQVSSSAVPVRVFVSTPGDVNLDGRVDIFDVAAFQTRYGLSRGATWADGDLDANGTVDIFDVAVLQQGYGNTFTRTAIVDNSEWGFAAVGDWAPSVGQGFQNNLTFAAKGAGTSVATWTFSVKPGRYRVAATWSVHANRATDAPFTVLDGSTVLGTVRVNQELAPGDVTDQGVGWKMLGEFDISGTTLSVQLSDNANEYVIADAIWIEEIVSI